MPNCGCFHEFNLVDLGSGSYELTTHSDGLVDLKSVLEQSGLAVAVSQTAPSWLEETYLLEGVGDPVALKGYLDLLGSKIVIELPPLLECYSLGPYTLFDEDHGPLQSMIGRSINQIKYWGNTQRIPRLGKALSMFVESHPRLRHAEVIVAPPPSGNKTSNLATTLAEQITTERNMRLISVVKTRDTQAQKNLEEGADEDETAARVADSMNISADVSGMDIIIIDDTIRSGGTMKELGRALLAAGAGNSYGLSLAKDAKFTNGGLDLSEERWKWLSPKK